MMGRASSVAVGFLVITFWSTSVQATTPKPPTLVARVVYLEGELLRYVPPEEDWVPAVVDSPAGPKDVFYSDKGARAEIIFPNRTVARLGSATQIEIIGIEPDLTDLYVASGQFRAYNRSADAYFRISTPFGYVVAPSGSVTEMYVGDESVEVASLQGTVQFLHTKNGYEAKYELTQGGSSIIADREVVARGEGTVDANWDRWNADRDRLWAQRQRIRSEHVPEPLQDDAWVLEEHGRWERVYYDGQYRMLWRPSTVAVEWAPFTVGRWTTWYEEQVWIPYEPFGYVTHHYGNWVVVGGVWYWMPPTITVIAGFPRPWVYWYPGRVAWIYTDVYVGWIPLAPWEPYYAVHFWGPGVTVWAGPIMPTILIGTLAFVDYAICVDRHYFWAPSHARGYYDIRITNINKTVIINNFRAAPVVHKTIFKDAAFAKNQYRFIDRDTKVKPHREVLAQIRDRSNKIQPVKASLLAEKINKIPPGKIQLGKRVVEPKVTHRLVRAEDADRTGVRFQEFKPKSRAEKPKMEGIHTVEARRGRPERPDVEARSRSSKGEPPDREMGKGSRSIEPGAKRGPEKTGGLGETEDSKKVQRPKPSIEGEALGEPASRPKPPKLPGSVAEGGKLPRSKPDETLERPPRVGESEGSHWRRVYREGHPAGKAGQEEVSPSGSGRTQGPQREIPHRRSPGADMSGPVGSPNVMHGPGRVPKGEGQPPAGMAPNQPGKGGHRIPSHPEDGRSKREKE